MSDTSWSPSELELHLSGSKIHSSHVYIHVWFRPQTGLWSEVKPVSVLHMKFEHWCQTEGSVGLDPFQSVCDEITVVTHEASLPPTLPTWTRTICWFTVFKSSGFFTSLLVSLDPFLTVTLEPCHLKNWSVDSFWSCHISSVYDWMSPSTSAADSVEAELVSTSRCFLLGDQNMRINRNQIWAHISFWEDNSVYSAVVLHPVSSSSSVLCRYRCLIRYQTPPPSVTPEKRLALVLAVWRKTNRKRSCWRSLGAAASGRRLSSDSSQVHFTTGKSVPVETHMSFQRTTSHSRAQPQGLTHAR